MEWYSLNPCLCWKDRMDEMIGHLSAPWPDEDDPRFDGIATRWTEARDELLAIAEHLDRHVEPVQ